MLVYNGYKWHIHFPFQRKVKLKDKDFTRPILSVDLGLNCTTTASIVYIDGTVGHREFINYASEKDRLYTLIGTIAVKSAQTYYIPEGSSFCKSLWRKVSNITEEIAHQCSARLVAIAANLAVRVLSLSIWVTSRSRKLLWSRKAEKEVPLLATGAHSEVHEVQGLWGRYPL